MKKLKAAVIGIGNMGRHHARIYSELLETELVAVSDLDEKKGKEIALSYQCNFYKNYQEMLDKEKPELVSIAVPTSFHYQIGMECIRRKIHVLIEKPIAMNIEEGEELIKESQKKGVVLMVGHVERYNPAIKKTKELIKEGVFGEIISLNARRLGLVPPKIKDINVIIDIGIHDIDIFNYLLEKFPNKIYAVGGKALLKNQEDYANIFLKYNSKVSGLIQLSWITPVKIRQLTIGGSKAFAEINYISQKIELYDHGYKQEFGDFQEFVERFGNKKRGKFIKVEIEEPLKAEIKDFIKSIIGEKEVFSPLYALEALKISLEASKQVSYDS